MIRFTEDQELLDYRIMSACWGEPQARDKALGCDPPSVHRLASIPVYR